MIAVLYGSFPAPKAVRFGLLRPADRFFHRSSPHEDFPPPLSWVRRGVFGCGSIGPGLRAVGAPGEHDPHAARQPTDDGLCVGRRLCGDHLFRADRGGVAAGGNQSPFRGRARGPHQGDHESRGAVGACDVSRHQQQGRHRWRKRPAWARVPSAICGERFLLRDLFDVCRRHALSAGGAVHGDRESKRRGCSFRGGFTEPARRSDQSQWRRHSLRPRRLSLLFDR